MKAVPTLLWLALACAALLGAIALFQDRLLYFPARAGVAEMVSPRLAAWPSAAEFRGLVAEPAGTVRGTVVVFHGNAGHAGHRGWYADALTPLGLRVVLAEYPGYGPRDGRPNERSLTDDAAATLALAFRRHGAPLLVLGESLGAGVAAAAAAVAVAQQREAVAGLMLITPWDRLANVAAVHYPFLPVRWLLRERYDSVAQLASFDRPMLIAVAERDAIVPARLGTALHAALGGRARLDVIAAAGHNDWPLHIDGLWWERAVAHLLGTHAAP